ncbi:hypothetical protein TNCV_1301641 [Trichonephila clavipes]|nr:hypothetical protein TNCV_1301641 [Trichonephila clavipes]
MTFPTPAALKSAVLKRSPMFLPMIVCPRGVTIKLLADDKTVFLWSPPFECNIFPDPMHPLAPEEIEAQCRAEKNTKKFIELEWESNSSVILFEIETPVAGAVSNTMGFEMSRIFQAVSHFGAALNSRRASSPLVRLVEEEEEWDAPDPQDVFPQNCDGTESIKARAQEDFYNHVSHKSWRNAILNLRNDPRRRVVAEFRLSTGHDCQRNHLYSIIKVVLSPICTLFSSGEVMDSTHLQPLSDRTRRFSPRVTVNEKIAQFCVTVKERTEAVFNAYPRIVAMLRRKIGVKRGVPAQVWSSSRMRVEITRFISESPRVASNGDTFKNQSKSNSE